jgi:hypothetical protein
MKHSLYLLIFLWLPTIVKSQYNFPYDFNNTGQRVVLLSASVNVASSSITLNFLDQPYNPTGNYTIYRRAIDGSSWTTLATVPATATGYTDNTITNGQAFEYKVKRVFGTGNNFATGHIVAGVRYDQTNYKGSAILLIDSSITSDLALEIDRWKDDLVGEGLRPIEVIAPRADNWEANNKVVVTKQRVVNAYNAQPVDDKPKYLFILGHVPIARAGAGAVPPDEHQENTGARGADCYYADIDGVYTDVGTYQPGFYINPMAINLPNDLKWDQDFIPSTLEMAFGRIDFADIASINTNEKELYRNYLNRLHNYRVAADGFRMNIRTGFRLGYDNSNDGSYRSLIPISTKDSVRYCNTGNFNQWVSDNGPMQVFMQNSNVPSLSEWTSTPMKATVFSSDQSYYGFWDEPEIGGGNLYGKIRALMAVESNCLVNIYTTTAINLFHQAGIGETIGFSCKRIMDHSISNQLYEKPFQAFDSTDYWNRTHFQLHGDPTVRLQQVRPMTNVILTITNGNPVLSWTPSPDNNIAGYHIYKASTRWGKYNRITTNPVTSNSYTDATGLNANMWYMVRAIKNQTTGSGTYLNPSIGVIRLQSTVTSINNLTTNKLIKLAPSIATQQLNILQDGTPQRLQYQIINSAGAVLQKGTITNATNNINTNKLAAGNYKIYFYTTKQKLFALKSFIKQ